MYLQGRKDFILERKLQLLLESEIVFSDKFKSILRNMDSEVAKSLLEIDNEDIDTQYNFIDTTQNNNTVSFTPDSRAQSMLGEESHLVKVVNSQRFLTHSDANNFIYRALNYEKPAGQPYAPEVGTIGKILREHGEKTTRRGNTYVVFEDENGRKTVLNKEALQDYDDNKRQIWRTARNNVRVGRLVRYLLQNAGKSFTDQDIEDFVNKYKSNIDVLNDAFSKFEIVSGSDIPYWYDIDRYSEGSNGVLGSSCMAESPSETFCLYEQNPNKVEMVILYDDSGKVESDGQYRSYRINGRALIWYVDPGTKSNPKIVFMDRIYTHKDSDVNLFREYAHRNGWYYKDNNTYTTNFRMIGKDKELKDKWTVTLNVGCDYYPYLDSFQYINFAEGQISNSEDVWRDDEGDLPEDDMGYLTSTDGNYEYW